VVDEVVCVVPRSYPHKQLDGASLEQRIEMLGRLPYRVVTTSGGLFVEMARELKSAEPDSEIQFICGRDAAERILHWDYGVEGFAERMLDEFGLLVAARQGEFQAPDRVRDKVRSISLRGNFDDVSSTEVRRRLSAGESWEHLVPAEIVDLVRAVYGNLHAGKQR
jgi:nicotinic acid mononucleotide adenylyltransferase